MDYETFPAAIPRFTGYGPFNQIPFQFSLHIFKQDEIEPTHSEFIFTENKNPDEAIIEALRKNLPSNGAVVVWYKPFEKGRNKELAERNPEYKIFLEDLNNRIIDIRDIFTEQHFIHPDFKGKTSIKNILPVLAPELSYKELEIQEGGNAAETWNKITNGSFDAVEKEKAINDLKIYCGLDTYAMYAIWKTLKNLI